METVRFPRQLTMALANEHWLVARLNLNEFLSPTFLQVMTR